MREYVPDVALFCNRHVWVCLRVAEQHQVAYAHGWYTPKQPAWVLTSRLYDKSANDNWRLSDNKSNA